MMDFGEEAKLAAFSWIMCGTYLRLFHEKAMCA
jgi:hypothetical protein